MIKGQEIIEELGFKLPELDCEEGALEIFFIDKYGTIHGRFGCEVIRWRENGVSATHPDKFNLVKVNWYDIPSNFPCLVKCSAGITRIALHLYNDKVRYETEGYETEGYDFANTVTPLTLKEVSKLIIKEGKC